MGSWTAVTIAIVCALFALALAIWIKVDRGRQLRKVVAERVQAARIWQRIHHAGARSIELRIRLEDLGPEGVIFQASAFRMHNQAILGTVATPEDPNPVWHQVMRTVDGLLIEARPIIEPNAVDAYDVAEAIEAEAVPA